MIRRLIVPALAVAVAAGTAASLAHAELAPGEQRVHPVAADSAMVVTQQALATEVGLDILRRGGNAVDAAVAVGFALAVTLPQAGNLGGGGFMIVHDADSGESHAIDYRETAPASAFRDQFLDASGEADPRLSRFTGLAVGVPGTVRGLHLAYQRFGSGQLSWSELMKPALRLARDGFAVPPSLHEDLARPFTLGRLSIDPVAAAVFYPDGVPAPVGSILRQPELAATLEKIAADGPAAFYTGQVAGAIAATVNAHGGDMSADDLAGYEAKLREPVRGAFRGFEIVSMPPPSSGGVHLVQILNVLEPLPLEDWGLNGAFSIHWFVEAARRAYADRAEFLGDPDFVEVPVERLTSREYAAALRASIDPYRATPSSEIRAGALLPEESPETTHFSIVDAGGNAVSNTYTLNFSFGVGFMAKGTGVLLNNELDDFSAKPGVPNAYGLVGAEANAVAPRKRPLSSMTPTIVLKDGRAVLVTGSPGGSRIITTTLQIVLDVLVHGLDIATATVTPRVHHQWLPDEIRIEQGISPDTITLLETMGHTISQKDAMGATQSIRVGEDGRLYGASDPRRPGGLAAGF